MITLQLDPPHPRAVHWLSGGCNWCKAELKERYIVNYTRRPVICDYHRRVVRRLVRRMDIPK